MQPTSSASHQGIRIIRIKNGMFPIEATTLHGQRYGKLNSVKCPRGQIGCLNPKNKAALGEVRARSHQESSRRRRTGRREGGGEARSAAATSCYGCGERYGSPVMNQSLGRSSPSVWPPQAGRCSLRRSSSFSSSPSKSPEREREERTFLPWPRVNPLLVKVT